MSTPAKVQEWLRNNDGNLSDAYRAVKYEGPPLKIKEGSLSTNRSSIRVSVRGDNGDTKRSQNRRLRPPQSKDEQNSGTLGMVEWYERRHRQVDGVVRYVHSIPTDPAKPTSSSSGARRIAAVAGGHGRPRRTQSPL